MPNPIFVHCEEVVQTPIIVTLYDVQVDVTKISAYHTIRMIDLVCRVAAGTATDADAAQIVYDIVREQNPSITDEELMRSANQVQLSKFVQTILSYVVRIYAPLRRDTPFLHPAVTPESQEK